MSSFVTAGDISVSKSPISYAGQNISYQNVNLKSLACSYLLVHSSSSVNPSMGHPLLSFTHPELVHGAMWRAQREERLDWDQRTYKNMLVAIVSFVTLRSSTPEVLAECILHWLLFLPCPAFFWLSRWCKHPSGVASGE